MATIGTLTSAVSGLKAAAAEANAVANNIANVRTPGFRAQHVVTTSLVTARPAGGGFAGGGVSALVIEQGAVDLASEMVNLIRAEAAFKASAATLRAADEMAGALFDIKA